MAQAVGSDLLSGLLLSMNGEQLSVITLLRHRETPGDHRSIYLEGGSMEVFPWGGDVEADTRHFDRRWLSEGGGSRRVQHGSGPSSEGYSEVQWRGEVLSGAGSAAPTHQSSTRSESSPRGLCGSVTPWEMDASSTSQGMWLWCTARPVNKAFSHPKCQ